MSPAAAAVQAAFKRLAKQTASILNLGPYSSAFLQGVGNGLGAGLPYVAGTLVLSALGMKRTAGLVALAGMFDNTAMAVVSEDEDEKFSEWLSQQISNAYRNVRE